MKFRYQKLPLGSYDPQKPLIARPFIPIYLIGTKKTESPYYALLDSGADRVIFPADLASEVGIKDIRSGFLEPIVGIGSHKVEVYYFTLKIQVAGDMRELPTEVGFAEPIVIPILGRAFFLHYKAVVFNEKGEEVELKT